MTPFTKAFLALTITGVMTVGWNELAYHPGHPPYEAVLVPNFDTQTLQPAIKINEPFKGFNKYQYRFKRFFQQKRKLEPMDERNYII